MSMNLTLSASIEAETKLGKKTIQDDFPLFQTPTNVTNMALGADPLKVYRDHIMSITEDRVVEDIDYQGDIFGKGVVVGSYIYNWGKNHLKDLDEWLKAHDGWNIEWGLI